MFSATFLLLFFAASVSDAKNVVFCYWPEDRPPIKQINLQDYNISKQIINTVKDTRNIDCYTRIWKGLSHLIEDTKQNGTEIFDLLDILFPLLPFRGSFTNNRAYNIFQQFISYPLIKRYDNPDWILREWNPFRDNIIGLAAYKNVNGSYKISQIYSNQMENDIATDNLELAGYVPQEFLSKLRDNKSYEDAQKVAIRMILIFNAKKFKGMLDFEDDFGSLVGVSIPGEYKGDHTTFLRGYFGYWMEFGSKYKDFRKNPNEVYLLSQMVFFGQSNKTYNSIEENYCINSNTGILTPTFNINTKRKLCLLNEICFDRFRLGQITCKKNSGSYICEENDCINEFALNERTKSFYEKLRLCSYTQDGTYCNKTLSYALNGAWSYFDFVIALYHYSVTVSVLEQRVESVGDILGVIKIGLSLLEKDKNLPQITPLSTLALTAFFNSSQYSLHINSAMILFAFNSNSKVLGFVVYENNTAPYKPDFGLNGILLLTRQNRTLNYSSDGNVRMIAYIDGLEDNSSITCNLHIYKGNFVENRNETSKSDLIAAYCPDTNKAVLKVYIMTRKLVEEAPQRVYFNEWFVLDLPLKKETVSLFFVPNSTVCNPMTKLVVYDRPKDFGNNMTYRSVDQVLCSSSDSVNIRKIILFSLTAFIVLIFTFTLSH